MPAKNNLMIQRQKLINLMDTMSGKRVIYVCAPAGYGKTLAVRGWLEQSGCAGAVIALDEYDNEPARFCVRFCAALRRCQPENKALHNITGHPAFESAPDEFALRAIVALSDKENIKLFIDDFHLINNKQVLHLLIELLKYLPENFQTVLAGRNELFPEFIELWPENSSIEYVAAENLLFSRKEIMLLYDKHEISITIEHADEIYRFTHGWAIGIGAVLLSGGEMHGESLGFLDEFIETNVWRHWDEETREFMLQTSVVQELIPELCSELTGRKESETLLNELVRQNAFIQQTDQSVYRYHHLFHNFLRQISERKGEEFSCRLLEKAGYWYLSEGDFYSAADCFIKCKSIDGIAKCFDFLEVDDRNNFVIGKIISVTQAARFAADYYPFLYYMMAWSAFAEGNAEEMIHCMDNYYARYPEIAKRDPAHAHNIFFMRIMDFRAPLDGLLQEIAALPAELAAKGGRGSITMNMPLVHRCTRDFSEWAATDVETVLLQIKNVLGGLFGEETNLLFECITAGLLYEQGHLDRALDHASAAAGEVKPHFAPESKFAAMSVLVYVLDALSNRRQAGDILKLIADMIEQDKAYYLNHNFSALKMRRRLAEGDAEAAADWLSKHGISLQDDMDFYKLYEHMATCRAYIAGSEYDTAIILLTKVLTMVTAYKRPLDILETQILLSIAYWNKGIRFQEDAVRYLEQAVTGASEYGYIQLFVNEGLELSDMLLLLKKRNEKLYGTETPLFGFINMICQKVQEQNKDYSIRGLTAYIKYTDKQLMVMRLLCEGRNHKEIAEAMGIKYPTLRTHIAAIYNKLNVANETEAVVKMKSLGIL